MKVLILAFVSCAIALRIKMDAKNKKRLKLIDQEIAAGIDVEINKFTSTFILTDELPNDEKQIDQIENKLLEIDRKIFYNEPFGVSKAVHYVIKGGAKITNVGLSITQSGLLGVDYMVHGFSKLLEFLIHFLKNLPLVLGLVLVLFPLIQLRKILQ